MHAPRWQAAPSPCDDTGDGHDRSALDPFGGGVRVCNGEVDAASKLIAMLPLPTALRSRSPPPWAGRPKAAQAIFSGGPIEEGGCKVDE